jgi:putative selenium metabolism hydrolase
VRYEVDEQALVELAVALAQTPSPSGAEGAVVTLAASWLERLGFDEVTVDEVGNVVGVMGQGSGPRLLIDGHLDTIPLHSPDRWTVDPHGGVIEDDRLYGLGICDQKASFAAAALGVVAARRAHGGLPGTVAVVGSVSEEENEGAALASVVGRFRPDAAITSEPNDTRLCVGQRGRAKVAVSVEGRACHAGHRAQGLNAVDALAQLIVTVGRHPQPVHDQLGVRDVTCIDVASWPYPSVSTVPGAALARFDCRTVPGDDRSSLLSFFERCAAAAWASWAEVPRLEVSMVEATFTTWTGVAFRQEELQPAWWTDPASPLAVAAGAALADVGLDPAPTAYRFCTNGSYLAGSAGIPTIGFGVGSEHLAHQVDEHVTLESLRAGAQGFASLSTHLLSG